MMPLSRGSYLNYQTPAGNDFWCDDTSTQYATFITDQNYKVSVSMPPIHISENGGKNGMYLEVDAYQN